jgi:branched-chain amino acid transport system substrate-binding protein
LVLAASAALVAAGCGGSEKAASGGGDGGGAEKTGGLAKGQPIVIGALQGPPEQGGPVFVQGMQIAAKEINDKGGIEGGHKIELKIFKTDATPESVTAAYREAGADKSVIGVFNGSGGGLAVRNLSNTVKLPAMTASGNDKVDRPVTRYVFANAETGPYASAPVRHAVEVLKAKTIAVLHYETDFSQQVPSAIEKSCQELGCKVVDVEASTSGASRAELVPRLTRMRAAKPDVYFIEELNVNALPAARDLGMFDRPVIGGNWLANTAVGMATGKAGEGVWFATQKCRLTNLDELAADDPMKTYCANYNKLWEQLFPGTTPEGFSVYGYDAVKAFAKATEKAIGAGKQVNRETITDQLESFGGDDLFAATGKVTSSKENHRLVGKFEEGFVGMMMKATGAKTPPEYYIPPDTPKEGALP